MISNDWLESGGGHVLVMLTGIAGLVAAALTAVRRFVAWLARRLDNQRVYLAELHVVQFDSYIVVEVTAGSVHELKHKLEDQPWPVLGVREAGKRRPVEYQPE